MRSAGCWRTWSGCCSRRRPLRRPSWRPGRRAWRGERADGGPGGASAGSGNAAGDGRRRLRPCRLSNGARLARRFAGRRRFSAVRRHRDLDPCSRPCLLVTLTSSCPCLTTPCCAWKWRWWTWKTRLKRGAGATSQSASQNCQCFSQCDQIFPMKNRRLCLKNRNKSRKP